MSSDFLHYFIFKIKNIITFVFMFLLTNTGVFINFKNHKSINPITDFYGLILPIIKLILQII